MPSLELFAGSVFSDKTITLFKIILTIIHPVNSVAIVLLTLVILMWFSEPKKSGWLSKLQTEKRRYSAMFVTIAIILFSTPYLIIPWREIMDSYQARNVSFNLYQDNYQLKDRVLVSRTMFDLNGSVGLEEKYVVEDRIASLRVWQIDSSVFKDIEISCRTIEPWHTRSNYDNTRCVEVGRNKEGGPIYALQESFDFEKSWFAESYWTVLGNTRISVKQAGVKNANGLSQEEYIDFLNSFYRVESSEIRFISEFKNIPPPITHLPRLIGEL